MSYASRRTLRNVRLASSLVSRRQTPASAQFDRIASATPRWSRAHNIGRAGSWRTALPGSSSRHWRAPEPGSRPTQRNRDLTSRADGGQPEGRREGDSLVPVGHPKQLKIVSGGCWQTVKQRPDVSILLFGVGQVNSRRVHQACRQQLKPSAARSRHDNQANTSSARQFGGQ